MLLDYIHSLPIWCFESAQFPKNPVDSSGSLKKNWGESLELLTYPQIQTVLSTCDAHTIVKFENLGVLLRKSLEESEPLVVIDFDKLTSAQLEKILSNRFEFKIPFPIEDVPYIEYSKSGRGLHIICKVSVDVWKSLPAHMCDMRPEYQNYCEGNIEYFTNHSNRFIVFTGNSINLTTLTVEEFVHPMFAYTEIIESPKLDLSTMRFTKVTETPENLRKVLQPYIEPLFSTGMDDRNNRRLDTTPSGDVFALLCRIVRFTQDFKVISELLKESYVFKNSSWGSSSIPDSQGKRYPSTKWERPYSSRQDPTATTIGEHTFHRAYAYIKSLDAFAYTIPQMEEKEKEKEKEEEEDDTIVVEEDTHQATLAEKIQAEHDTFRVALWGTPKNPSKAQLDAKAFIEFMNKSDFSYENLPKPYLNGDTPYTLCKDLIRINPYLEIRHNGDWYSFDYLNKYYKLLEENEVSALLVQLLSKLFPTVSTSFYAKTSLLLKQLLMSQCIENANQREFAKFPTLDFNMWLEGDEYKKDLCMMVNNGILNVTKKKIMPKSRKFFAVNQVPIDITEEDLLNPPTPTRWLRFLHEEFEDDVASIEAIQRFMGYCLSTTNPEGKGLFLLGATKAGKSTILHILQLIFSHQCRNMTLQDMKGDFALAGISNLRVYGCSELHKASRTDMSAIEPKLKALISPVDTVMENEKYKRARAVRPKCKTILIGNELPPFSDEGKAISERFIYINFSRSFAGREDPTFIPSLEKELKAIFLWILKGYQMWYQDYEIDHKSTGLLQPNTGESTKETLIDNAKPNVYKFIEDCCETPTLETEWCPIATIRPFYKLYCETQGTYPVSEYKFTTLAKAYLKQIFKGVPEEMFCKVKRSNNVPVRCIKLKYLGFRSEEDLQ